jgi:hypothetical protein
MVLNTTEPLDVLAPLLTIGGIIAIIAYAVSLGTRSAHKRLDRERGRQEPPPPPAPLRAFPVQLHRPTMDDRADLADLADLVTPADLVGPGRFVVKGVDRETRMDTQWVCEAESEANARVKAELEGIVVTAVERA